MYGVQQTELVARPETNNDQLTRIYLNYMHDGWLHDDDAAPFCCVGTGVWWLTNQSKRVGERFHVFLKYNLVFTLFIFLYKM